MPDAVAGVRRAVRELVDGTLRVTIDIEPRDRKDFWTLLPDIDSPVALAALHVNGERRQVHTKGQYSNMAQTLWLSPFFKSLSVCKQIGSDEEFLAHVRTQPCANCEASPPSEAAHVRRVKDGAGVGIKPQYMAIPLCHECHTDQHAYGENVLGGRQRVESLVDTYRHRWGWDALKMRLGYTHWYDVPPDVLHAWAREHDVSDLMPPDYI